MERTWGTYRYNVYLISGLIFTVVGAIVLYVVLTFVYKDTFSSQTLGSYIGAYVSTYYINMSIFLAFAATYPEEQLMLYFIIPIKIKWFGVLYGAYILIDIYNAFSYARQIVTYVLAIITTVLIVMSLLNFILYFISLKKNGGAFSAVSYTHLDVYKRQALRTETRSLPPQSGCVKNTLGNPSADNWKPLLTIVSRYCHREMTANM